MEGCDVGGSALLLLCPVVFVCFVFVVLGIFSSFLLLVWGRGTICLKGKLVSLDSFCLVWFDYCLFWGETISCGV